MDRKPAGADFCPQFLLCEAVLSRHDLRSSMARRGSPAPTEAPAQEGRAPPALHATESCAGRGASYMGYAGSREPSGAWGRAGAMKIRAGRASAWLRRYL